MNYIQELANVSPLGVILGVFIILECLKYIISGAEWIGKTFGLEFKWKKRNEEDHGKIISFTEDFTNYQKTFNENIKTFNETMGKCSKSIESVEGQLGNMKKELDATKLAVQASLGDRINSRYQRYIALNGIPEEEYDEFQLIYEAYKGVDGNHKGDAKYKYCTEYLEIIPDKTKNV